MPANLPNALTLSRILATPVVCVLAVLGTALGNWLLNANATFQDPRNLDTNEQLARRARFHTTLSATYVAGAFKGGIEWKLVGPRYDAPHWLTGLNQARMAGYT